MVKGVIFDYGGTLDTGGHHWGKVIWHAYEKVGVPVSEELFREAYVHGERTLARNPIIKPHFTFRQTLDAKLRIQLGYIAERQPLDISRWHAPILDCLYANTLRETERSRAVLTTLKDRLPMVLVSNFYGNIATVLAEFHFDGLFAEIIESAVVGVRKPDPQIFTLGVEALGMQPDEVVVVGDSYDKDIAPAKRAGCHTIWIKGEGWTDNKNTNTDTALNSPDTDTTDNENTDTALNFPAADKIITDIREIIAEIRER